MTRVSHLCYQGLLWPRCQNSWKMLPPLRQQCSDKTSHRGTRNHGIHPLATVQLLAQFCPPLVMFRRHQRKSAQSRVCSHSPLWLFESPATDLFDRYRLFAARRYRHWKQCQYTACLCRQSFESELLDGSTAAWNEQSIVDAKSYETSRSGNCNEYADWYRPGLAREVQGAWQNPARSKNRSLFIQGEFLSLFDKSAAIRTLFRSTNMHSATKLHC